MSAIIMVSHHEESYSERGNLAVCSVHKTALLELVEISQGQQSQLGIKTHTAYRLRTA